MACSTWMRFVPVLTALAVPSVSVSRWCRSNQTVCNRNKDRRTTHEISFFQLQLLIHTEAEVREISVCFYHKCLISQSGYRNGYKVNKIASLNTSFPLPGFLLTEINKPLSYPLKLKVLIIIFYIHFYCFIVVIEKQLEICCMKAYCANYIYYYY